jgi:MFS family permease
MRRVKKHRVNQERRRGGPVVSLLGESGLATIVLASFAARLPLTMMGLATLFFVQAEASVALAGLALAAFSVAAALLAPLRGRYVDRRGIRRGVLPLALAHAAATAALIPAAQLPGSPALLLIAPALGGATAPPVNAAMRALWPNLVPSEQLDTAYSVEAVLQEVAYICGPLLTGLLVWLFSPQAPIIVAAVLVAVGGLLFSTHEAAAKLRATERPESSSVRSAGVRTLLAATTFAAVALGALEVAVPLFGEEHGSAATGGLLLSLVSVASLAGGAWYGTRRWSSPPAGRLVAMLAVGAAGCAAMVPAASTPTLAIGLMIFGLTLAPSLAVAYSILDDVAPWGVGVEAVAWMTTASAGGAALGAAVAGIVVERSGSTAALAVATGAMALAAATVLLGRDRLSHGHAPLSGPINEEHAPLA